MFSLYCHYTVFGVLLVQNCCTSSLHLTDNTEGDIPWNLIETWLEKPLRDVHYLHLKLRSTNYLQDVENPYAQWFLKQAQVPLTINTYELVGNNKPERETEPKMPEDHDKHVIVTSMQDLRATAQYFAQRSGTYFFVFNDEIDSRQLRDICHILWTSFQILQNFLLTANGVLIYDPFAVDDAGEYGQIITYTGARSMEGTLFYNMRGYPLRVQIFQSVYSKPVLNPVTHKVEYVEGLDGRVADILQKLLNFTMNLLDPDPDYFGERLSNGSYNGAIGSVLDNTVDICLTGFFVKDYFTRDISFSVAMYEDQLCIYTRKAERVPDYILPIFAIHYNVWIGFISIAFISSLVWVLLRSLTLSLNMYNIQLTDHLRQPIKWQYLVILKDTWVVWVRVCLNHYPVFKSEKVFVASLCLVSVIFGAIFECSLASSHIEPLYFTDIKTLEGLHKAGLSILYRHASMGDDLFVNETSPLFASLNSKTIYKPDRKYKILNDIIENGGKAGVNRYNSLMLESLDVLVSKRIWIIPEFPKRYSISYVWLRQAPWEETFNNLLLQFLQAGVISKFERDMKIEAEIKIMRNHLYESNVGFRILTVRDFQLAFYVVIIGNLLAALSWVIEHLLFAYKYK